jgi:hypothetical protein
MWSLLTIFFFIVMWLMLFGVFCLVILGCLGLCLDVLLICLTACGPLASQRLLRCGKWCLHAYFDVYGGKGMIETLRTKRGLWGKLFLCSLKL